MKLHPILLVLPWSLIIAELDYMTKKKKRRRVKRLEQERVLKMERERVTGVVGAVLPSRGTR